MLFRPREGNELLLIISWIVNVIFHPFGMLGEIGALCQMAGLAVMTRTQIITETPRLMRQLRKKRPLLLWGVLIIPSVVAAILPLDILGAVTVFIIFVALVLLNLRLKCITTLANHRWGQVILPLLKLISVLSLAFGLLGAEEFTAVVLLFGSLQGPAVANDLFGRIIIDVTMNFLLLWTLVLPSPRDSGLLEDVIFLSVLLIGNFQIPVAVAQIVLPSLRLVSLHGNGPNMKASVAVFYVLALLQGSLHFVACILALFSFFPRRSLVRRSDFRGKWAAKAVDLYYESAYITRMEAGVFAEDTISLASFALDSLTSTTPSSTSSSREKQLAGVRVLDGLLQRRDSNSRQEIISVITRSEKAVPTLIGMLGWTFEQDRDIRLFAARVTKELSGDFRIASISGAVKLVSSLLDAEKQSASVDNEGGRARDHGPAGPLGPQADGDNHQIGGSTGNNNGDNNVANNQPQDEESSGNGGNASNRRSVHEQSEHRGGNHGAWCWSWVCQCCLLMKKKWSIPDERPLTSSLPILGLEILESLACDADDCAEIIKVTNLVPKIVGLTSYSSSNENSTDNALMSSSLNLLRRLATTNGKVGASLRQELWESPFLLSNLACILEDSRSSPQVWKPAMDIIAIMSWDEVARQELGSAQVIIHKLVHVFIVGQDGPTSYDRSVRVAAGEALTNLAMESPANCLAILEERRPGYELARDLKGMLGNDEYRCVAASLLQNLCAWSRIRDRLRGPGATNHLSSALPVVLENIMGAEGKQLEALIGLASKICYVLPPQCFIQGLEPRIIGETCVRKLVDTLNSNKRPSHEYPRMRRAIVEMVISVLGRYPHYAVIFRREGMMDALSKAETSPSRVEKYRVFLGNEGVVLERGLPLRDLVTRARWLIDSATSALGARPNDCT
ncbi:hypothetical protein PVAP13_7KG279800 [Panicum virgatum]|nr:hypothetical protein PVAP13_7KG279800 [Panicum virgatum]KAG2573813.1 hypothetical protein PVAP13_7KG279800 [Panicum virgatum]